MTTIHRHSGCNGPNCRTKIKNNESQQDFTNALIGIGIGLGVLNRLSSSTKLGKLGSLTSVWNAKPDSTDTTGNTKVSNVDNKRSSEDIKAEIDNIYANNDVSDEAGLTQKATEANTAYENVKKEIETGEKTLETAQNNIKTAKDNVSKTKDSLANAEKSLKNAQKALGKANIDDPNYFDLVQAESEALATKKLAEQQHKEAQNTLEAKEKELNEAKGALKQLKAEEVAKKEAHDSLVQAQDRVRELKNDLEKATAREAREKEEAEKAEAKRKKEEEIGHLSNGDTAAIAKLIKQIGNASGDRKEDLTEQLHAALEIYYQKHNKGDNKTIDNLPEASIHWPAV